VHVKSVRVVNRVFPEPTARSTVRGY
jgi:hypothetical protein